MALELVYTSAQRGLRPGASGFCTVAMTKGMPPPLVARLESLGGYRPGPSGAGPVARCFWRIEAGGSDVFVLAVVGPAPPDHTHRTNKIASYLVLSQRELVAAGPAWVLGQSGIFRESWRGPPVVFEEPVRIPASGPASVRRCAEWERCSGDAGWAGVLASQLLRDPSKPVHVIWRDGHDPLALVGEVLCLMPDWARWRTTFSTYFLQPVAGVPCVLRMCLDGTPAADAARRSKTGTFDLARMPGSPPEGRFVRMARTGVDTSAASSAQAPADDRGPLQWGDGDAIELEPIDDDVESPRGLTPRRRARSGEGPGIESEAPFAAADRSSRTGLLAAAAVGLTVILGAAVFALSSLRRGPAAATAGTRSDEPAVAAPGAAEPISAETASSPDQPSTSHAPVDAPPKANAPPPAAAEASSAPMTATTPVPAPAGASPPPTTSPGPETRDASPSVGPGPPPVTSAQEGRSAPDAQEPPPLHAPLPALPSGLLGPRWRLESEAGPRAREGEFEWSRLLPSTEAGIVAVRFLVPDALRRLGVVVGPDGARLSVEGAGFAATASVSSSDRTVRVSASIPEAPLPPAIAECLSIGGDTPARAWTRLLSTLALELVDRSGKSCGLVQCATSGVAKALEPATGSEVRVRDPSCVLLLAQVYLDPGAPDQRRLVRQAFVPPGSSCALDATALVRIVIDRGSEPGFIAARAACPEEAEVGRRRSALQAEAERLGELARQLRAMRDPNLPADVRNSGLTALAACWSDLSEAERIQVSPSSPSSPPSTAEGIARACTVALARLEESRRLVIDEVKELNPADGMLPKMVLRIVTAEGAIVDDLPIRRDVRDRRWKP